MTELQKLAIEEIARSLKAIKEINLNVYEHQLTATAPKFGFDFDKHNLGVTNQRLMLDKVITWLNTLDK